MNTEPIFLPWTAAPPIAVEGRWESNLKPGVWMDVRPADQPKWYWVRFDSLEVSGGFLRPEAPPVYRSHETVEIYIRGWQMRRRA